ncbi:deoxyribonuclease V [Pseudoxanthomonas sp.]|uniref:deoxyribonuclease V n=1 Tax=Pseudoxanthomonas sp. TaxID=1871049 RepID=UPI0026105D25|nr:deoxyribonuclease V [Pseudoxanthomonas sp.]WDS36164.1 MAG: deoxyribonuclease V [Pseudoxanthomonas sp.]
MNPVAFGDWDGSIAGARALQSQLAAQVSLVDEVSASPRTIAGFDVGFEDDGATTRAAAVLLDGATLQLLDSVVERTPTTMPYVPGLLSFRELPALLLALERLPATPELVVVDGQGIAHPRRLGIAAHFGVVTGLPTIGVAKKVLCGRFAPPGPEVGARTPLIHQGEQIAWMLRSKLRCNPLVVSPGHRVSMDHAVGIVMALLRGYRLPEPTRLADRLASRRGPMPQRGDPLPC